jgi:hypothetical protein
MFKNLFQKLAGGETQVPVLTDVLLTQECIDNADVAAAVQMNVTILNHFLRTYRYLIPEVAPESVHSYSVDFYYAQVMNGGHGQFAHNAKGMPNTWKFAREGLGLMGANEHLKIFDQFEAIIKAGGERASQIIRNAGFSKEDPEVEALDNAFYELEKRNPVTAMNGKWIKSLPNTKILPLNEMQNYINSFSEHSSVKKRMA